MAIIKIFYFDLRGRAEVSRLLMAASGKEWEDVRFSFEDWPKYKPNAPFGQAPYMEYEGKTYGQSVAIANFLAREFGFYGKTNLDDLVIDQVVQTAQDLFTELVNIYHENDESKKAEMIEKVKTDSLPKYLNIFDKLLKENGSSGYFVGNELTLADIVLFDIISNTADFTKLQDVDKDFPEIQKVRANVEANPNIRKYLDGQAAA